MQEHQHYTIFKSIIWPSQLVCLIANPTIPIKIEVIDAKKFSKEYPCHEITYRREYKDYPKLVN